VLESLRFPESLSHVAAGWLHLTGKRTVNIRRRPASPPDWLALVCIAVLLVASTAQAAHFCGFRINDTRGAAQLRLTSPNGTLCLTCLMAQSATAMVLLVAFFSVLLSSSRASSPELRPRVFLESFQLYVRPPPAY
jgi:hypothetical protein